MALPSVPAFLAEVAAATPSLGSPVAPAELGRVVVSCQTVTALTREALGHPMSPTAAAAAGAAASAGGTGGVLDTGAHARAFWTQVVGRGGVDALLSLLDASGVQDVEAAVLGSLSACLQLAGADRDLSLALRAWVCPNPEHLVHAFAAAADAGADLGECRALALPPPVTCGPCVCTLCVLVWDAHLFTPVV